MRHRQERFATLVESGYSFAMGKSVYLETSVFSFYYDERVESAYRHQVTRDWWRTQKRHYSVYTSFFAIRECASPAYPNWRKVASLARRTDVLEVGPEIEGIVAAYITNKVMPADDAGDAAHLAVSSFHGVDYLMTWNCRHLANANKFDHTRAINRRLGLVTPELVTPEQLFREER
ncbi:MAG: putative nucleic acid-binding protein [Candidatus Promineifilaceae bacterium]